MSVLGVWRAEDAEAGAQRIAGRPAQAFWRRIRSSFRGVLLEPHRRAGDGRVSWTWTGPSELGQPTSAELAGLRKRLGAGLANLLAELERDEEAGGGEAAALHTGMEALISGLTGASDNELAAFAVRTETGWMIRSWGIARPSAPRRADEAETAPPPAEVPPEPEPVHPPIPPQKPPTAIPVSRRRTLVWIMGGVAALGLLIFAIWVLRERPKQAEAKGLNADPQRVVHQSAATGPVKRARPAVERSDSGAFFNGAAAPAKGLTFSNPVAAASRVGGSGSTEPPSKVVPVPMAYTGLMATPPEAEPKPPETQSGADQTNSVQPDRDTANPGQPPPSGGSSAEAFGLPEVSNTSSAAAVAAQDALQTTSAEQALLLGEAIERAPKDALKNSVKAGSFGHSPDTSAARVATTPEAPPNVEAHGAGNAAQPKPEGAVQERTAVEMRAEASHLKPSVKANARSDRLKPAWSCQLGEWRLARTRDVALATVPSEVGAEGEVRQALASARREAWEKVRAALPLSLRQPATRAGWVLVFTKAANAATAPVWRVEPNGEQGVLALAGTSRAEISWAEPFNRGLVARLVGPDDVDWACIRVTPGGRTIAVQVTPDVLESAPWFEVRGAGAVVTGRVAVAGLWRSLRSGWLDTRWQQEQGGEGSRVYCFAADPRTAPLPITGVVALDDSPSGWALAREVQLDPGP